MEELNSNIRHSRNFLKVKTSSCENQISYHRLELLHFFPRQDIGLRNYGNDIHFVVELFHEFDVQRFQSAIDSFP